MQDRVPLYPGRVMLTPVPGQENTFDMVRADSPTQEGTPLNKANLLKDATAAMFGLGDTAVPDEVLAFLGQYAQHWWRRRTATCVYRYDKVVTSQTQTTVSELASSVPSATLVVNRDANTGSSAVDRTFSYATSIKIDQSTGEVQLVNPNSTVFKVGYSNGFSATEGTYFTNVYENPTAVYKGANTMSYSTKKVGSFYYQYTTSNVEVITSKKVFDHYTDLGDWEYVTSISKETYPENGYLDGYVYEYLGIPFDNAVNAPKFEKGSYIGTGTYGSSNPCSLTFGFSPSILIITGFMKSSGTSIGGNGSVVMNTSYGSYGESYSEYSIHGTVVANGNQVQWYSEGSASEQMNTDGSTYYFVAIG